MPVDTRSRIHQIRGIRNDQIRASVDGIKKVAVYKGCGLERAVQSAIYVAVAECFVIDVNENDLGSTSRNKRGGKNAACARTATKINDSGGALCSTCVLLDSSCETVSVRTKENRISCVC